MASVMRGRKLHFGIIIEKTANNIKFFKNTPLLTSLSSVLYFFFALLFFLNLNKIVIKNKRIPCPGY